MKKASPSPKAARLSQWLTHFGLTQAPFSKDIEDGDLWMPTSVPVRRRASCGLARPARVQARPGH